MDRAAGQRSRSERRPLPLDPREVAPEPLERRIVEPGSDLPGEPELSVSVVADQQRPEPVP